MGSATVVDVGGGIGRCFTYCVPTDLTRSSGGMSLDLAKMYHDLKFVIQDRPAIVKQGQEVWERDYPEAVKSQRVKLMPHDFFTEQPIKGAAVYHMRYILYVSSHTRRLGLALTRAAQS